MLKPRSELPTTSPWYRFESQKNAPHFARKEEKLGPGVWGYARARRMSRGEVRTAGVKTEKTLPKKPKKGGSRQFSFSGAKVYIREACEFG